MTHLPLEDKVPNRIDMPTSARAAAMESQSHDTYCKTQSQECLIFRHGCIHFSAPSLNTALHIGTLNA